LGCTERRELPPHGAATRRTGRFADGQGGFVADIIDIDINLDDLTLSYSFQGTGEVSY